MRKKTTTFVCLLLIACMLMVSAVVMAKKPKPPGPGPGPEPTGTIFFRYNDGDDIGMWTMNADGSEKTLLGVDYRIVDNYIVYGAVSRGQHGGHYWFIRFGEVDGEPYPDEQPRLEIFAVRDDGTDEVQLTSYPNLAYAPNAGPPIFSIGDDEVTWGAKRWVDGVPVDFGIYSAQIDYDIEGNIVGLLGDPDYLWNTGSVYNEVKDQYYPDLVRFDWSPDEAEIVLDKRSGGMYVVDLGMQSERPLTDGYTPQWSPDGSKIAFIMNHNLLIINPDGTNEQMIVEGTTKGGLVTQVHEEIAWSPDSTYLVYTWNIWHKRGPGEDSWYVYRVDANGDHKTCLTNDLPASSYKASHTWR